MLSSLRTRAVKKLKSTHVSPILIGKITFSSKKVNYRPIKILVDSGASGSIVLKEFCNKCRIASDKQTNWSTKIGTFSTNQKCTIQFRLPELDKNKIIVWNVHADDTISENSRYDPIMG